MIQNDGTHYGKANEEDLNEASREDGWNITSDTQLFQSPETNVLDLGLFNSLKTRIRSIKQRLKA